MIRIFAKYTGSFAGGFAARLIICLAGVLLNVVITILFYRIPLYMDTIMTVAVTFLCGLPWGVLCGVLTSITGHTLWFWSWLAYLFTLCSIATAIITWLFIRFFPGALTVVIEGESKTQTIAFRSSYLNRIMDRVVALILLSFALCIAMSILGGLISVFIQFINNAYTDDPNRFAFLGRVLFDENSPVILVEIMSRIPVNIVDRLIAAFAGFGIALGFHSLLQRLTIKV
ncbi:MAG: hypothetical protein LBH07_03175 [Treponema sp.]|nr:hypothetical protein [Treponema sp.]